MKRITTNKGLVLIVGGEKWRQIDIQRIVGDQGYEPISVAFKTLRSKKGKTMVREAVLILVAEESEQGEAWLATLWEKSETSSKVWGVIVNPDNASAFPHLPRISMVEIWTLLP